MPKAEPVREQLTEIINWTCYRAKEDPVSIDKAVNRIVDIITERERQLLARLEAGLPEKQIPHWRSHKGDEIDHARAIGFDEAITEMAALLKAEREKLL